MKCFNWLTASAVLLCASIVYAEPLPPVPPAKTPAKTAIKVTEKATEPAPLPKKTTELTVEASAEVACGKQEAPMPPVPHTEKSKAKHVRPIHDSIVFVANELIRKPIHDLEWAACQAEGRALDRENRRLHERAEVLAEESARLAEREKNLDPHDLSAKLHLVRQERDHAKKANNLAVDRAAWELKKAAHEKKKAKLAAQHEKLARSK